MIQIQVVHFLLLGATARGEEHIENEKSLLCLSRLETFELNPMPVAFIYEYNEYRRFVGCLSAFWIAKARFCRYCDYYVKRV
jgi:hypothetical protein